jgi:peroxiredoxin
MIRASLAFLVLGISSLAAAAQSRVDLLQRAANYYSNLNSFDIKGTASALVPGTSWRVSYKFETEGAQPAFLPLSLHAPSMQVISTVGNFTASRTISSATDPKPQESFVMMPFGTYGSLTKHLVDAQKIGTETIPLQGGTYSCEIIDATYDTSPEFKPHSQIQHRRIWIDPTTLWILRETRPDEKAGEWTASVTSITINQPPSQMMVKALQDFASSPKDRPDWIGHPMPALTLAQLSGPAVNLADLHGKPVLLDFWGSYCPPCKRGTLLAQEYAKRYQSSGLIVLTLTQDTVENATLWTKYNHVTLPVLLDTNGTAFKAFDVQGVPDAILFNAQGKIVHYWLGFDDPASIESVLDANLLPKPSH